MRWIGFSSSLLLIACSFDSSNSAGPSGSADAANPAIDGQAANPSIDASTMIDTDGDQILDEVDNCPSIPNPNQRNEDRDSFGNLCDNCPAEANQDQANADNDGLGDMCDPQPAQANQMLHFEGFDIKPDGASWGGLAAWQIESGSLVQNDNGQRHYLHYNGVNGSDKVRVVSKMQFSNPSPNTMAPYFRYGGVFVEANADPDGNGCWLLRDTRFPGSQGYSAIAMQNGSLFPASLAVLSLVDNTDYVIASSVNGTTRSCSYKQEEGEPMTLDYGSSNFVGQGVGLVTSHTQARVAYFYVVSLQ